MNANRVYLPVHTILFLIRLRRSRGKGKLKLLLKRFKGWVKSCLFAAFFALSIPFCGVYLNNIVGPARPTHGFVISFLFSWFILFESYSRWGEMSIWVLAQWFESIGTSLDKRRMNPKIPYLTVRGFFDFF
jgi:hypothetical protein